MQKIFNHKVTQLTIGLIAFTFLITSMPNGNFYEFIWWLQWSVLFLGSAVGVSIIKLNGGE